ncbi:hypothetical protein JNUCC1_01788 [Lentibacillus sp. JNUCC-1]|uniref:hypothetical protein n=1 Tax=Lentibacillus sp. JNUCC-1 TaxID=2654513 RepID=UPI0012E8C87B|nr:hypothetical protein [Lentibacillus sp. JNUCC-1]MUV37980.1 hypothetical protein [Lentibacillus sp. JNUCC-1]
MGIGKLKIIIFTGSALAIIGLCFILFSDSLGTSLADGWIAQYDYPPKVYEHKVEANTNKFLVIGGILFATGMSSILFVLYTLMSVKSDKD